MTWAFLDRAARGLRLRGIGRGDPHATIARVDDAFGEARASIVDVHFFAGVHTVLTFEIAREALGRLAAEIARAGVELDPESLAALERAASEQSPAEVEGTLAITLARGDPDLLHEVPAVPG